MCGLDYNINIIIFELVVIIHYMLQMLLDVSTLLNQNLLHKPPPRKGNSVKTFNYYKA